MLTLMMCLSWPVAVHGDDTVLIHRYRAELYLIIRCPSSGHRSQDEDTDVREELELSPGVYKDGGGRHDG